MTQKVISPSFSRKTNAVSQGSINYTPIIIVYEGKDGGSDGELLLIRKATKCYQCGYDNLDA